MKPNEEKNTNNDSELRRFPVKEGWSGVFVFTFVQILSKIIQFRAVPDTHLPSVCKLIYALGALPASADGIDIEFSITYPKNQSENSENVKGVIVYKFSISETDLSFQRSYWDAEDHNSTILFKCSINGYIDSGGYSLVSVSEVELSDSDLVILEWIEDLKKYVEEEFDNITIEIEDVSDNDIWNSLVKSEKKGNKEFREEKPMSKEVYFTGDSNDILKKVQNDAYYKMLERLYHYPKERYLSSLRLIGVKTELAKQMECAETWNIHILMPVYDRIAAYFRFTRGGKGQMLLQLQDKLYEDLLWQLWVEYYDREVKSISMVDSITIGVLSACSYGQTKQGLAALEHLNSLMKDRYVFNTSEQDKIQNIYKDEHIFQSYYEELEEEAIKGAEFALRTIKELWIYNDPAMLLFCTKIGAKFLESGSKTYRDYENYMKICIGDKGMHFLKPVYQIIYKKREMEGDTEGMTSLDEVQELEDIDIVKMKHRWNTWSPTN